MILTDTVSNCNLLLWSTTHTVHLIHSANVCWWSTLCWSLVTLCWLVSRWQGLNSSMQQHSGPSWWHGSPTHWVPASRVSQWWGPQVGQVMPWASYCPMACMWLDIDLLCKVFSLPCGLLLFFPLGGYVFLCVVETSGKAGPELWMIILSSWGRLDISAEKVFFQGQIPLGSLCRPRPALYSYPALSSGRLSRATSFLILSVEELQVSPGVKWFSGWKRR